MSTLFVNGERHHVDVDPETPLLWVLRDHLGLTEAKYSCGIGECGACTVHMDGEAVQSCTISLKEAEGRSITTLQGLTGPLGETLKEAWIREDVSQCGYCQPGQIMTAAALLKNNPTPDDPDIEDAMSGTLCRCGTYQEIKKAIHRAAGELGHGK
jgi:isoquinoline 1-oxidoreductase subunit alpha